MYDTTPKASFTRLIRVGVTHSKGLQATSDGTHHVHVFAPKRFQNYLRKEHDDTTVYACKLDRQEHVILNIYKHDEHITIYIHSTSNSGILVDFSSLTGHGYIYCSELADDPLKHGQQAVNELKALSTYPYKVLQREECKYSNKTRTLFFKFSVS